MTTKFDIRKYWQFAVGAIVALFLYWVVQQVFFSKDEEQPSGRNYKKEYIESQREISRLKKDSLLQRYEMQKVLLDLREENLDLQVSLKELTRHYEKLNFRAHTFDELDAVRDSVIAELRKEQGR